MRNYLLHFVPENTSLKYQRVVIESGGRDMVLRDTFRLFYFAFLDFVYPPSCLICQQRVADNEKLVCFRCRNALPRLPEPVTRFGAVPVISVWKYSAELHELVHAMKYQRRQSLITLLGTPMAALADRLRLQDDYDVLIPVPLHPVRRRERGYNQSELLARIIAERTGISINQTCLVRSRYTRAQAKLGKTARARNIQGAFGCRNADQLTQKRVILVDDVVTTGSTVMECVNILIEHGVHNVVVLTAARTVKDRSQEPGVRRQN
jgi:ComF family protein